LFGDPLVGAQIAKSAVGSILIVVDAEVFDDDTGFAQVKEQLPIEAFIPKPGMEALDPAVLPRTAGGNIDGFNRDYALDTR
jgi:hypothetical protein